jgi:hypothetical protein
MPMHRLRVWPLLVLNLVACETRPDDDRATESAAATPTDSVPLGDSVAPVEFEAPRLIPGVRAQMEQVRATSASKEDVAAFRAGLGRLVDAMEIDLNRAGVTDTGYFGQLSDSVLRSFGGGASDQPDLPPEEAGSAADQVDRLIAMYTERMRTVTR